MQRVWVLCVVCGVLATTPALEAATLPHTAQQFLAEIREALGGQWEIIKNIQYHTVSTKLRLANIVNQIKEVIAPAGGGHVVVHDSSAAAAAVAAPASRSFGNDLDTHIPEASHQGITDGLGNTESALLNYTNYDRRVVTSETSVREAVDSEQQHNIVQKPPEPEESHTTTDGHNMAKVLAGLGVLFRAEDRHLQPPTSAPAKQDFVPLTTAPPETMMKVLAGLEAVFNPEDRQVDPATIGPARHDLPPTSAAPLEAIMEVLEGLEALLFALNSQTEHSPNRAAIQDLPPTSAVPPPSIMQVLAGLEALSRTHDSPAQLAHVDNNATLDKPPENVDDIIRALAAVARHHGISVNTSGNVEDPEVTTEYRSLLEVLEAMDDLSRTVGATRPIEEAARHRPCESPFEEIAYRMCILQETTLKLSWGDARDYCRRRGAELAQDAVVIKTRRFLNDLYGESGTRSRWPIWVGGIERSEGGERVWKWVDGSVVPSFIWSDDQPRPFTLQQAPDGTCMFLDGYKRFYAASLPCHLKRRFVCQRHD
ncbi:uncharacterized protein [Procambarus clarkii]|uniref:uncharacterized protein isoform X1 n=1 Tax=Procambarus clarkii TaxID=6728 RepID=UPI001E673407|nr:uncharacterized protein LOC123747081 isoform X1 [Procambarus clarkii]